MAEHLRQAPDLLPTLLTTLFEIVLFEDCSNQWSLSRPMLSLILVNEQARARPAPGAESRGAFLCVASALGAPAPGRRPRRMRWSACRHSSELRSRCTLCRALQKKEHTNSVCSRYALPEGSAVVDAVGGEAVAQRCAPPPVSQQGPGVARALSLAPAPQIYGELRRRIIATQPADRQAHLAACLDKLMADVQRTLEPKNRDKFTQARAPGRACSCARPCRCSAWRLQIRLLPR